MNLETNISLSHILLATVGWTAALIGTYVKSIRRSDRLEYRIETLEDKTNSVKADLREIKDLLLNIQLQLKDKADKPALL
jgi:uncharacterized protein (DUF342 family)